MIFKKKNPIKNIKIRWDFSFRRTILSDHLKGKRGREGGRERERESVSE